MPKNPAIKLTEKNRFSRYVSAGDRKGKEILAGWQKWFEERDIESVLHFDDVLGFAIYRELPEGGWKRDGEF
jgi:hypothetical protein